MDTAYSEVVDRLVLPRRLAGHPALELCNTRAGWGEPEPREYLETYDHLVVLARAAGLLSARTARELRRRARLDAARAAQVLGRALRLREALYAVLVAPAARPAWEHVAREAHAAAEASELVPSGRRAAWRLREEPRLDLPVLAFASAAADLLTSPAAEDVAGCPGHGCGWLFLSRGGRRRWCTMATCGNRAKVRRHAERARHSRRAQ